MNTYTSLIDFIGDVRAPERLSCPPGGTAGCNCSDAYLRIVAEKARLQADPLEYLRSIAIKLHEQSSHGNWQSAAAARIASWRKEFIGKAA